MNTMNHKGCSARIEYDERDNIFVGRVLGLSGNGWPVNQEFARTGVSV